MTRYTVEMTAPLYIRVSSAPEVFGLSVATIYRHANSGAFEIYKRGNASLLKVAEVAAWIDQGGPVGPAWGVGKDKGRSKRVGA